MASEGVNKGNNCRWIAGIWSSLGVWKSKNWIVIAAYKELMLVLPQIILLRFVSKLIFKGSIGCSTCSIFDLSSSTNRVHFGSVVLMILLQVWKMPLYGNIVVIKRDGTDGAQFPITSPVCTVGRYCLIFYNTVCAVSYS